MVLITASKHVFMLHFAVFRILMYNDVLHCFRLPLFLSFNSRVLLCRSSLNVPLVLRF